MTDYVTTLRIDFGLILPELLLLAAASVILLFAFTRKIDAFAPVIAALGLTGALLLALGQWSSPGTGFAGMVTVDRFGVGIKILCLLASSLSLLLAYRYLQHKGIERPEFYALLLISTFGMIVMGNSTDLVVLLLGLEIMSVPLYVMAGFHKRSLESNEAGIKYFMMGAFSTGFLLLGIAFLYGAAETTNLQRILTDFSYIANRSTLYLYTGAALVLVGFGFKVAAVPFHSWVPDVYQGAPTPVTAFFSVAPKAAAFAALLRAFNYGLGPMPELSSLFWVLAVLTMTVGNVLALRQENLKRMLAYSSIAHAGYVLVGISAGGPEAVSAALFYLVAYMLFNVGAFAVLIQVETGTGGKADIVDLAGLSRSSPYLALLMALFMFALTGFPPTVGFLGKLYLFSAAYQAGFIWLTVIAVLNSFVSVYYYLRVIKVCYFDSVEVAPAGMKVSPSLAIVLLVSAIGTLLFGLLPQPLLEWAQNAVFASL